MQKRYIVAALIGGVVGFSCQFIGDNFLLHPVYKNSSGDCEWVPGTNSQFMFLGTGDVDRYVARMIPKQEFRARGHDLVYQQLLILWVRDRAELASRTAILTAFWFACVILGADQMAAFIQKKRLSSSV